MFANSFLLGTKTNRTAQESAISKQRGQKSMSSIAIEQKLLMLDRNEEESVED